MGGLFEPICMRSSTEGASPPEKMIWMHADLQIEVEKRLIIDVVYGIEVAKVGDESESAAYGLARQTF